LSYYLFSSGALAILVWLSGVLFLVEPRALSVARAFDARDTRG
jgi:hypothetical protein